AFLSVLAFNPSAHAESYTLPGESSRPAAEELIGSPGLVGIYYGQLPKAAARADAAHRRAPTHNRGRCGLSGLGRGVPAGRRGEIDRTSARIAGPAAA